MALKKMAEDEVEGVEWEFQRGDQLRELKRDCFHLLLALRGDGLFRNASAELFLISARLPPGAFIVARRAPAGPSGKDAAVKLKKRSRHTFGGKLKNTETLADVWARGGGAAGELELRRHHQDRQNPVPVQEAGRVQICIQGLIGQDWRVSVWNHFLEK